MEKAEIIREIRRLATVNNGVPVGWRRLFNETGIKKSDWEGVYWARWNDALREAGFAPNQLTEAYEKNELLEKYAKLALELGRLPTNADLRLKTRNDPDFPHDATFARLGGKLELVRQLVDYCRSLPASQDVAKMCDDYILAKDQAADDEVADEVRVGYVYLLKHGSRREYKIGRTNNPLRREGEVRLDLPEKIQPIHVIKTDDPAGVEAYWHRRFADQRKEGEWFSLTPQDVRAFKRWRRIH